ncbi:MAG: GSCFA domain-containing protein [Bacteroidales bacterium]|nr:GSCFA domain-containing protein [Bacteroidales bacterium]
MRHWKDGHRGNQVSKSILHVATDQLVGTKGNVSYFPAYELLMDDLRDYRFFADDMLHPNQLAISYIWDKFKACYFSAETISVAKEVENINNALNHRTLNPDSTSSKNFFGIHFKPIKKSFRTNILF